MDAADAAIVTLAWSWLALLIFIPYTAHRLSDDRFIWADVLVVILCLPAVVLIIGTVLVMWTASALYKQLSMPIRKR